MQFLWQLDVTPLTPIDRRLTIDPITQVEGLMLMYMYELHGYTK